MVIEQNRCVSSFRCIFVHLAWTGKEIARELLTHGLKDLKENRLEEAHLQAKAQNQNALQLYWDLGFEVIRESGFYVLMALP